MKILAISGSLRDRSSNTALLKAIAGLIPDGASLAIYDRLGSLPFFNPDIDGDHPPDTVKEWRTQLQDAAGVMICTPEYAHGIPGVLKNALDWIVSSGEFMHKPTAVISASPSLDGGKKASASLVQTLEAMMANITEDITLSIPAVSAKLNHQGEVTDPATVEALRSLVQALIAMIDETTDPASDLPTLLL
jgi:chromate reductase, NAD(P)H dehydrogenase (quinone)